MRCSVETDLLVMGPEPRIVGKDSKEVVEALVDATT